MRHEGQIARLAVADAQPGENAHDPQVPLCAQQREGRTEAVGVQAGIGEEAGDGSVLDNTLLIWVNEHQKGNNHDRDQIPYVIAGGAGGAVKSGRWLQVDGKKSHNDLWSGCMNAMGLPDKTFGDPKYCTTPLNLA